jgi:tetratricopeptide (TPR) repeat protein
MKRMRRNSVLAVGLGLMSIATAAEACFFGVPWQLFDHRSEIRQATPVNSFAWEAEHLVPVSVHQDAPVDANDSYDVQREAAEKRGLGAAQLAALAAMRAAPDAQAAWAAGGELPDAIRLYTAGGVAFAHGDSGSASKYFAAVLGLPPGKAASRSVWAAYMLGRMSAKAGDARAAGMYFGKTRELAAQGAADPLRLATASLGDEARLRLDAADTPGAVALYAEQAAARSSEAVQSLRMVAEGIMANPDRLEAAVRDRLTQRLLVVHALALTGDYLHALHTGGTEYEIGYDGFFPPDDTTRDSRTASLQKLFDAIRASGVAVAGTDRLAALAYELADFASAKALAESSNTPLALWIQAKVALENDDEQEGAKLMAQALRTTAEGQAAGSLEPSSVGLLHGEASVWDLGRGDFSQAMSVLWPVAKTYWGDVAYLAERVLTTDELRAFVDAHAPEPEPPPAQAYRIDPVDELRGLLARRLMRDGRYQEALGYFDHVRKDDPDIRADAAAFAAALDRSRTAFWAVDRAQAGWVAATLLRNRGMEMMGTETSPDNAGFEGGELQAGYGPGPGGPSQQQQYAGAVGQNELVRYDASRAAPDLRYHYRYLAADQAVAASAELPPRTQAFAAMLCTASEWMFSSGATQKARAIYSLYLKAGAVVPFATHFGHACPAPRFQDVTKTQVKLIWTAVRDVTHRHGGRFFVLGLVAVSGVIISAISLRMRRRRAGGA